MNGLNSRRSALLIGFVVLAAMLSTLVAVFSVPNRETVIAYFLPGTAFDRHATLHAGMLVPRIAGFSGHSSERLAVALAMLTNGTPAKAGQGLTSAIPAGGVMRVRDIRSGIVQLDVPSAWASLRAGSVRSALLRAQLEATCRAALPGMRMLILVSEGRLVPGFSY